MSGFHQNVGVLGDWIMPPSPTSTTFFSPVLPDTTDPPAPKSNLAERLAARAGFNAPPRLNTSHISVNQNPSQYLTIPPGLSPTTLLDSPVFLSNSLAQPSPTTGKFSFLPSSALTLETVDTSKVKPFDDINNPSFTFKPVANSFGSSYFLGEPNKVSIRPENTTQELETATFENKSRNGLQFQKEFDNGGNFAEQSPPLDEQQDDEGDLKGGSGGGGGGGGVTTSEDGYNWRKYGQKQVKGSEYPRSYYKCTYPNCQVKKKVERSHEGHITEIIYKGAHNHPKPPSRRPGMEIPEQAGFQNGGDEVTSSGSVMQAQSGGAFESGEAVDVSSTFSNEEEEDDRGTHGSVSLGYDAEEDESESKRRKIEAYATEMSGASRAIREPRVVVQTTSEVDILDDGYRWRKYGQKVVKGNPNPRSYYKCTNAGCTVRKHVERASHDLKSVITTYEGKHNHDVPVARNQAATSASMGRVERVGSSAIGSLRHGLSYQPPQAMPLGIGIGIGMGMQIPMGMSMAMPTPIPYLPHNQQQHRFMFPKSDPDSTNNNANANANTSSLYQHHNIIPRLPQI